jgi:tetratricopeptide (TPR) repeat protein
MARAKRVARTGGKKPAQPNSLAARSDRPRDYTWLFAVLLLALTLLAYQPAWNGKPIWDDDAHIPRPELRSLEGLKRILTEPGAAQQYYPILFGTFWLEHKLWGDAYLGYHIVNILAHIACAFMLGAILSRLKIRGSWLAAGLFALHPIEVESVAWIAELKNTLSGCFYFGAALFYLRFDETRRAKWYVLALVSFLFGLASKTVIATLAAALLILLWWRRGKLSWKRDILPVLPFFAFGAVAGLYIAWMEHHLVGAHGAEFDLSLVQRCLLAGRIFWFYLAKLFWPADLAFIYPRWHLDPSQWWQYLFPIALLVLVAGLFSRRQHWRGSWTALLYYLATLGPVLGFLNVYPFRYSFVADHFQYLAGIGPLTLVAAAATTAFDRFRPRPRLFLSGCLFLALFALTWKQSWMYRDLETLWRTTLARNPAAWLAHNNFGTLLLQRGQTDEAFAHFQRALELYPNAPEIHNGLGNRLWHLGRLREALGELEEALRLDPNYAEAHNNLGNMLLRLQRRDEAVSHFATALKLDPNYAAAHSNLGNALLELGRGEEAADHFRQALNLAPDFLAAHYNLANYLLQHGQTREAIEHFQRAVTLDPGNAAARTNLGAALQLSGRWDEAQFQLEKAVELNPVSAEAHNNLGNVLTHLGRLSAALEHLLKAVELEPQNINALNNAAWLLATSSQKSLRDGPRAVELAQRADDLSHHTNPVVRATMAAALAENGLWSDAVRTAEQALDLANKAGNAALAEDIRIQLQSYRSAGSAIASPPQEP